MMKEVKLRGAMLHFMSPGRALGAGIALVISSNDFGINVYVITSSTYERFASPSRRDRKKKENPKHL